MTTLVSMLAAALLVLVAGTATAQAVTPAPGSLDTTFASTGRLVAQGVTPFSSLMSAQFPSTDVANAMAVQPDGKIVVVGTTTPSGSSVSQFAVERFFSNGALDASFGSGGQVATPIINDQFTAPLSATARAVVVGSDGTILVAGDVPSTRNSVLVRYHSDGSVDTSFGNAAEHGIVVGCCNSSRALALLPDGKILVGGSLVPGVGSYFSVNRLLPDGSVDTSFGQNGSASGYMNDGNDYTDVANSMAVLGNGTIVLAGSSSASYPADRDFAVERFTADGRLDTTFGGTGRVRTSMGSSSDSAASILAQPDGKLLAVGSASNGQSTAMARYLGDGSLDPNFGQSGQVIYQNYWGSVTGAALQSDGRIIVVGTSSGAFMATRFDPTGALDPTFNDGGSSGAVIGGTDTASAVAVQQDGRILAVGTTQRTDKYLARTITSSTFGLARFASDGSLDTSFGAPSGVVAAPNITPFLTLPVTQLSSADVGRAVAVQTDGKVVAVGSTTPPGSTVPQFAVERFLANGGRDLSFGTGGRVGTAILDTAVAPAVQTPAAAYAVVIQPDGKILVAGDASTTDDAFAVVRYNPSGSVDTSFGDPVRDHGVVFRLGSTARALAVQADGKILIAGTSRIGTGSGKGSEFTLTRLNPDGTLDAAFGPGGAAHALFDHEFTFFSTDVVRAMAVQPDGKILLAGSSNVYNPANTDFALARFNTDGTPDTAFGAGGRVRTDLGSTSDTVASLLVLPDQSLAAVGSASNGQSIAVARYTPTGALDTGYANHGEALIPVASATVSGAALQGDGRILVAATAQNATDDFELLRINPNGVQDTTFGSGGVVTTSMSAGNDEANALVLQPDGKPLVVGSTQRTDTSVDGLAYVSTAFALARYNAGPAGAAATITSPASAPFTVGQPGSFTVRATGSPTPSLSLTGPVPAGLSFTDNGDGTGTLAGTPVAIVGDAALTLTASNGFAADAVQTLTATLTAGALDHLTLAPATPSVAPGVAQAFTAEGADAGGNDLGNVTPATTFSISPDGSCTESSCSATSVGPHTVTGTSGGKTGTATLTVTAGPLHTLVVSPASPSVAAGATQAYTTEAFDEFGNDLGDVTPATTFSIGPDGSCTGATCTATTAGPHTVTVVDGAASSTAALAVTAGPQDHLLLSPATSGIAAGGSQSYAAESFDQFGNDLGDVTSATTFAIAPDGTCTGATCTATAAGTHTITATNGGKTGVALLTVSAGALDHLVLSPATSSVTTGAGQSYTAAGVDRFDNALGDLTSSTTFAIAPDGTCTGATCMATTAGPHAVTGTSGGQTGSATLNVTAPVSRIVFSSVRDGNAEIYTMNPDGTAPTRLTQNLAADTTPSWSPDHRRIAFSSTRDGNAEIYVMNADGTGATRLTRAKGADTAPRWSPDGQRIVFASTRDGNSEIYVMNADGTGATRLTRVLAADTAPSWSPDGTRIVFSSTRAGNAEIYAMNPDGTGVTRLTTAKGTDTAPTWSPGGSRIVFSSTRDGNAEIYAMNADGTGATRLTRAAGVDTSPSWSPDGARIVFSSTRDGNAEIYAMNADGTGVTRLTTVAATDASPAW